MGGAPAPASPRLRQRFLKLLSSSEDPDGSLALEAECLGDLPEGHVAETAQGDELGLVGGETKESILELLDELPVASGVARSHPIRVREDGRRELLGADVAEPEDRLRAWPGSMASKWSRMVLTTQVATQL